MFSQKSVVFQITYTPAERLLLKTETFHADGFATPTGDSLIFSKTGTSR